MIARALLRREGRLRLLSLGAASAVGAAVAWSPRGAIAGGAGVSVLMALSLESVIGRAAAILALAGNVVLLYGFANLGIPAGPVAVPITELLLVPAFVWAVVMRRGPAGQRAASWWTLFLSLGITHLLTALPRYGVVAVRDALLPLEAAFLLVGYRLGREGWERAVRWLRWIFLAAALYFAAYPAAHVLATAAPVVGIQRDVPLLGQYAGAGPAAVAGFFFMALLRPLGVWSFPVAGFFLAELLLFQGRGDYLSFVASLGVLLALAGPGGRRGRVRLAVAGALVGAVFVAALLLPLAPAGRLGPVSPEFYAQHVGTLVGREGPGAGTIRDRLQWISYTTRLLTTEPHRLITGVGYGPSLTGGFTVGAGVPVRQPHNDYLEALARLGLPGLVAVVGLLGSILLPVLRAARHGTGPEPRFLWWVGVATVPYLLIAAVQPLLAFPYGTVPLFTIGGLGLGVVDGLGARVGWDPDRRADGGDMAWARRAR